jgi:hypothetical protein
MAKLDSAPQPSSIGCIVLDLARTTPSAFSVASRPHNLGIRLEIMAAFAAISIYRAQGPCSPALVRVIVRLVFLTKLALASGTIRGGRSS